MGLSYNTHWVADIRNETLNRWAFVGGSNGNADELTNWDGTNKRGLGI